MERVQELVQQINALKIELKKEMRGCYECSCGKIVRCKTAYVHNVSIYHITHHNQSNQTDPSYKKDNL